MPNLAHFSESSSKRTVASKSVRESCERACCNGVQDSIVLQRLEENRPNFATYSNRREEKYLRYAAMVLSITTILIAFFCALGCCTRMEAYHFG
ncbi:hypothetical protein L596_024727 [Steinernema carpocapsae]|uniref:Uncharacterized protein n=1 Tax=Steinernema carpocapsae TaxID=34508 RepID=A0A4V5ZYK5_STECR|nr:hypothetical protein L596_024727 [Steinernema carpocapsae]